MYNKTIIRFGFCDIRNNQGLGKYYDNTYRLFNLMIDVTIDERN